MYNPTHFAETNVETLHAEIERIGLGALVIATSNGLEANHVPFQLERNEGEFGTLRCHVARNNDAWRHGGAECLVIFQGPSAYISPNNYTSKREHGKVVPTYNYVTVHAHGKLVVHDDENWLRGLVGRLTKRFEADQPKPWTMGDAPPSYIEEMLKQIVGLEIAIRRLEGKWKMSQNRSQGDRAGVVEGLSSSSNPADRDVALIVEKGMRDKGKA